MPTGARGDPFWGTSGCECAMTGFSNSTAFPLGRRAKSRPKLGCLRGDLGVLAGPAALAPSAAAAVRAAEEGVIDGGVDPVARAVDPRPGVREEVVDEAMGDGFRVRPGRIDTETSADSPSTPPPGRTPPPRIFSCGGALESPLLCPGRPASRHAAPGSGWAESNLGTERKREPLYEPLPGGPCPAGTLPPTSH